MKKTLILSALVLILLGVSLTVLINYSNFSSVIKVTNIILDENIEALTQGEEPYPTERLKCIEKGGNWNMASVCEDSGIEQVTCNISGEISAFGITIKGSYQQGKKYYIPWARYKCTQSLGNCCKKQGLYSGEIKLA